MKKGDGVRDFFTIEANSILERYKSIEKLLPAINKKGSIHPAEEGRFLESLIRSFLNKHLPSNLRALSGFILKTSTKTGMTNLERVNNKQDENSSQLDIIVYDIAQFPVYEMFEEFCVVPPEGVIAVISVKKTLRMVDIEKELMALLKTAEICKITDMVSPHYCLFSFKSDFENNERVHNKIFSKINKVYNEKGFDLMVNEISILNSQLFFKYRMDDSDKEGFSKYVIIDLENKSHIALSRLIQSILGVYYKKSINSKIERPGFISFKKGTFGDSPVAGYVKIE